MPGQVLADGSTFRDSLDTRRLDAGVVTEAKIASNLQLTTHWSFLQSDRDRTFDIQEVQDSHTVASGEATVSGVHGGHQWLLGLAVQYDRLSSGDAPDANYDYVIPAVFVQDQFSPAKSVTVSASARVDAHSDFGTFFSPRLSVLFRPH